MGQKIYSLGSSVGHNHVALIKSMQSSELSLNAQWCRLRVISEDITLALQMVKQPRMVDPLGYIGAEIHFDRPAVAKQVVAMSVYHRRSIISYNL